jgi:PhzF family phenazine biosynthesis protein
VDQGTLFAFVDVFAEHPLAGNPLAVVPDADHLDDRQMRAIAQEFNQSETTFLVRPATAADWRLRSFTPAGVEVLGAGHNALGAWLWLAHSNRLPAGQRHFVQQIGPSLLGVEVTQVAGRTAVVTMQQSRPEFGGVLDDRQALVAALGLAETDLLDEPAQVVSTGAGHLLVPLRSRAAVPVRAGSGGWAKSPVSGISVSRVSRVIQSMRAVFISAADSSLISARSETTDTRWAGKRPFMPMPNLAWASARRW